MRFADPQMFWWLSLVPLLIVGIALRYSWRRRQLRRLGWPEQVEALAGSASPGRRLAKTLLLVFGISMLIAALARPQAGERTTVAPKTGLDVVVALDFSKSMLARDAFPSRLERAKVELSRLLDQLRGDRVGLVAFAGETIAYPLTTDYAAAKLFWRDMSPNDMPVGGTAIGKAITAAVRLLRSVRLRSRGRSQVVLLLTDGEDHQSDPIAAANEAKKLGIRIYTVGIGSSSGEPIPLVKSDGSISGYLRRNGKLVTTRLDSSTLRKISSETGGAYLQMDPSQFAVEPIIEALAGLKRSELASRLVKHYDEVYQWFLFAAFLMLLLEACLSERRQGGAIEKKLGSQREGSREGIRNEI